MNAADLMTRDVATCRDGESLARAAHLMWEHRAGCVVVIDDAQRPLGVLSDRDVCMAAYTQGRCLNEIPIAGAMSRPAHTCKSSASIEEAEDVMVAHACRRLVVVDSEGRALGVLSLDDVARSGIEWNGRGGIDLERTGTALGEIARQQSVATGDAPASAAPGLDLRAFLDSSRAALVALRQEIGREVKLAGHAARERWHHLEESLEAAEAQASEARRKAARHVASAVHQALHFRRQLHDQTGELAKPS